MNLRTQGAFCRNMFLMATLVAAVYVSLGATDSSSRFYKLSHKLMCTCSCSQILGECNHVGCQQSTEENAMLSAAIAAGKSDQEIFDDFTAKYGATVLAAPPKRGFDLTAWIAPFAVFAAALVGTILLVRRWSSGRTEDAVGVQTAAESAEERELRDKIRQETGSGGF